ncbi:MAG: hypothetical protein NTV60_00755 [Candidatus Kaiserbacteria bacterium]|nr:hypothetical protein [Candidatus Kaiserbacteria bacterium]
MITQQLLDYIAQEIQGGSSPDTIKAALRSNGWIETDIEQAFARNTPAPQSITPPIQIVEPTKTEYFIPSEKKSPALKIILIIAGVLLAAGGAYAAYTLTASPSLEVSLPTATTTTPVPEPLPVAPPAPEIPLDIATTTATTTLSLAVATSTATSTPATIQDCGSVNTSRMSTLNGVSAMNAQDKAALACGSKAFATCSPITLLYTTTGTTTTSTLKINGLTNSNCSLTMISNTSSSKPTCKVPMDLMTQIIESAKKNAPGDLFSYPVASAGLFFVGTPLTNTLTGKKVTLECTK